MGEEGELAVRGPNVMLGYFRNEEATANTIKDGWLHTGSYTCDGHANTCNKRSACVIEAAIDTIYDSFSSCAVAVCFIVGLGAS